MLLDLLQFKFDYGSIFHGKRNYAVNLFINFKNVCVVEMITCLLFVIV